MKLGTIDLNGPGATVNEEFAPFLALFVRFKGQRKGGVTENASYYIFTQCADGAFEAFPVNSWYNFTPLSKHRTLTAEEAEEEWSRSGRGSGHTLAVTCVPVLNVPLYRRNKVVNHFSIMLQRRLREENGEEEEDEGEKSGKKKKKGGGKGGDLRIYDLEDELEMSSDDSDCSVGEGKFTRPPDLTLTSAS